MRRKSRSRVFCSTANYHSVELVEKNTEAVTVQDPASEVVLEITPYRKSRVAQVVTMRAEQFLRIDDYLRKRSEWLASLNKTDLQLDLTFVPERNWNEETLSRVPAGSAVFPVMSLATVPLEKVKDYLSQ